MRFDEIMELADILAIGQHDKTKEKEKNMALMLSPVCILILASFSRNRPQRLLPPFEGEHLNGWGYTGRPSQGQASCLPAYSHYEGGSLVGGTGNKVRQGVKEETSHMEA
jgi:hypothetical protein